MQEAWLRAERTGTAGVDNIDGWLTTITSRVCLDVLRSRTRAAARALPLDGTTTEPSPEDDAVLADAIGPALLVVLDTLTPAARCWSSSWPSRRAASWRSTPSPTRSASPPCPSDAGAATTGTVRRWSSATCSG